MNDKQTSENVVLFNHTEHILASGPLTLKIGANTVKRSDLETAAKHPLWKNWKREGWISYDETEDGVKLPDNLQDITAIPSKEAITTIQATFNLNILEAWKTQEKANQKGERVTVTRAIDAQIEAEKSPKVGNVAKGKVTIDNPSGSENNVRED